MSADRWSVCPRCVKRREAQELARDLEVAKLYGTVGVEEFMAFREQAEAEKRLVQPETFRQDWEIYGAEEALIVVSYSAGCSVCHLSVVFSNEHPIDLDGPDDLPF